MKFVKTVFWTLLTASVLVFAQDPQPADGQVVSEDDVVVTATRTNRQTETIPAQVSVITEDDIEASNAKTVPDLLRGMAGVYVNDLFGNGTNVFLDMGGFGEAGVLNLVVLVDGVRLDYADLASTDWTAIPLNQIERIEVVRGGNSALYGGGATGGIINIITKSGRRNQVSLMVKVDSWGYRESTEASGNLKALSFTVKQGFEESDGYRSNNNYRSKNLHLGLTLKPEKCPLQLDLRAGYNDEDFGLPGNLSKMQLQTRYDNSDSDETLNNAERTTTYVTVIPRLSLDDGTHSFQMPISYRERESFYHNVFAGPFVWDQEFRDTVFGISPQYTWKGQVGDMDDTLTLGVEFYRNEKHAITNASESHRETLDAYISNTLVPVDNVFIDLAYRHGRADFAFDDFGTDLGQEEDAYHAGIAWNYQEGSKLFFSYDRSYRFGSLDEYTIYFYDGFTPAYYINTGLDPQITTTWKLGSQHKFCEYFTGTLTLFQIDTDNEIFYDPNESGFGTFGANDNYEETRRQGFTVELKGKANDRVSGYLNYTYMNAKLGESDGTTNYDGNDVPLVPENTVSGGTEVALTDALVWNVDARWVDKRVTVGDWNNSMDQLSSYYTVDTRLTYSWKWLKLFAGVSNLTDQEYIEYGSYGTSYWPGLGRNIFAGFKATFDF